MDFEALLRTAQTTQTRRLAVAAADDDIVLQVLVEAKQRALATAILCGPQAQIQQIAQQHQLDISGLEIMDCATPEAAAAQAVALVRQGRADMLMKGRLPTATLLQAVLEPEQGLRGAGLLSHVAVVYVPALERIIFLTDAAIVPYPDLHAKVGLIANACRVARAFGFSQPKVAAIAAVETVNPKMPATVDAALLTMMNRRGQIKDCLVDGPLAVDLALSPFAVEHKGLDSPVAGQADILLFPNIEAANSVIKTLTITAHSIFGGLVIGAQAPIVLTSRGASAQSKLYAIACAAMVAAAQ